MQACDRGLCLRALSVTLNGEALVTVDAMIAPAEVLTVMGPSGAGKSTLLAAIAGTLAPAFRMSGSVILDGREVAGLPTEARRVGILFQDDLLFAHLSVAGNLAFGLPAGIQWQRAK